MKKVLFSLFALFIVVSVFGQNKKVVSVALDTITKVETVYLDLNPTAPTTKDGILSFQVLCSEVGGTSDGVAYLEFSVDGTSYVRFADAANNDWCHLFASDTSFIANNGNEFAIEDGAVFGGMIETMPWKYYRIACIGS